MKLETIVKRFMKNNKLSIQKDLSLQGLSYQDESPINEVFKNTGLIQLRPYNNETKLVIGCGNVDKIHVEGLTGNHKHGKSYTINDDVRYNPSLVASFGIHDLSKVLKKGSFKTIVFENYMLNCFKYCEQKIDKEAVKRGEIKYFSGFLKKYKMYKDTDFIETDNINTVSSLLRLLSNGGKVYFNKTLKFIKQGNKLVSVKDSSIFVSNDSKEDFYEFSLH